jgi:polyadenylate-binding protein 2
MSDETMNTSTISDIESTSDLKDESGSNAGSSSKLPSSIDEADAEIEAMKKRVREMEEEALKIEAMQSQDKPKAPQVPNGPSVDARSVYVGNVEYATTPEELQEFFQSCGTVNRITILCDKYSGHPKGYAYVEFKDADAVAHAMLLNETEFKGRPLKVSPKRTNIPGLAEYRPAPRRVRRFGGYRPRRFPPPYAPPYAPSYAPSYAPRPRYRNRRGVYHPYY